MTVTEINGIKKQIREAFMPNWELNDAAHRQAHFEMVFQTGCVINLELGLGFDEKLILFSAYFHDLFAWTRFNHHEMAFHWLTTTDHPVIVDNLTPAEVTSVAWACMQHRASFKGEFRDPFCELINSADREFPDNFDYLMNRCLQHREKTHAHLPLEERRAAAIQHLKEKAGTGGYCRFPDMYLKVFGDQLAERRKLIDAL